MGKLRKKIVPGHDCRVKKKVITTVLCCFVVIAILMSAMPVQALALESSDDVMSAVLISNDTPLRRPFVEQDYDKQMHSYNDLPSFAYGDIDVSGVNYSMEILIGEYNSSQDCAPLPEVHMPVKYLNDTRVISCCSGSNAYSTISTFSSNGADETVRAQSCDVYVKIDDDTCAGYEVYVDGVYQFTEGQDGTPDGDCAFYVTAGTHTLEIRKNGRSATKTINFQCGYTYRWVSMPDNWCEGEREVKFRGELTGTGPEGMYGVKHWYVKVNEYISGALPLICDEIDVYMGIYPPMGSFDVSSTKGDRVEVFGSAIPGECTVNLNGESYYIKRIDGSSCGEILDYAISDGTYPPGQKVIADMKYKSLLSTSADFKGVFKVRSPTGDIYTYNSKKESTPAGHEDRFGYNKGNHFTIQIPEDASPGWYDAKLELRNFYTDELCDETEWLDDQFKIDDREEIKFVGTAIEYFSRMGACGWTVSADEIINGPSELQGHTVSVALWSVDPDQYPPGYIDPNIEAWNKVEVYGLYVGEDGVTLSGSKDYYIKRGEGCGRILDSAITEGSYTLPMTVMAHMKYKNYMTSPTKFKGVFLVKNQRTEKIYSCSKEQITNIDDRFGYGKGNSLQIRFEDEVEDIGVYDAKLELRNYYTDELCDETEWMEDQFKIEDGSAPMTCINFDELGQGDITGQTLHYDQVDFVAGDPPYGHVDVQSDLTHSPPNGIGLWGSGKVTAHFKTPVSWASLWLWTGHPEAKITLYASDGELLDEITPPCESYTYYKFSYAKKVSKVVVFGVESAFDDFCFEIEGGQKLPVHNIDTGKDFATIQAAIDDSGTSPGDTITADPGTYTENVKVTKSLTIKSTSGRHKDTIVQAKNPGGPVFEVIVDDVTISEFTVDGTFSSKGIYLNSVKNCAISNNNCSGHWAIVLGDSSNNAIIGNNCSNNDVGIFLGNSNNNALTGNNVTSNYIGIEIGSSSNNILTENTLLRNNWNGVYLQGTSSNNQLYHNNFISDSAYDLGTLNQWDNGYPSGGNYWSDYDEESEGAIDEKSGPNQDQSGRDGIADTAYEIPGSAGAKDNYPLMVPYVAFPSLCWPIEPFDEGHPINLVYGDYDGEVLHEGIDIPCNSGTLVYAIESGEVMEFLKDDKVDETLVIKGEKYNVSYTHIDVLDDFTKEGASVALGDKIGEVKNFPDTYPVRRVTEILDGKPVDSKQTFENFVPHLHLAIVNDSPTKPIKNPLLVIGPDPPYNDPPLITCITETCILFREDESCANSLEHEELAKLEYLNPNELKGKVDIVANVFDNIGATKNAGVYKIEYKITNSDGNPVKEGTLFEWNKPLPPENRGGDSEKLVGVIYERPLFSYWDTDTHISTSFHYMWYIVTNTDNDGKIESMNTPEEDLYECWDTTQYDDGGYTVTITAWDARNNEVGKNSESIDVIVKNRPILPVPYFHQGETNWCVMNSVAMVMQYWGERVHSWDLARILQKGPKDGIDYVFEDFCGSVKKCVNTLSEGRLRIEECGWETIKHSSFEDTIVRWIDSSKPVIFAFPYPDNHAVVVCGYSHEEDGDYVFVHNPGRSKMWTHIADNDGMFKKIPWEDFKGGYELVLRTVISPTDDSEPNPPVIALNLDKGGMYHPIQSPSGSVHESYLELDKGIPYKTNQDIDLPGFDCPSSNCLRYLDDMTINGYQELDKRICGYFYYSAVQEPQGNYQLVIKNGDKEIHTKDLDFSEYREENRALHDSFNIPIERFEIGEVHLIMEAGGDKIGPIDFELRTISKPDLAITRLWFNENLGDPGDDVEIIFDVTNQGSDVANPCVDCLYIDGSKVVEFDSSGLAIGSELKLGETRTWYYLYKDVPGTPDPHKIKACADCQNSVTESDENNNCKSDTLDITPIPDFTPLDLCMVLDRSGSMGDSIGTKTKIQGVKEAATGVVNVLLPQDRVSMVSFSDTATTDADLTGDFSSVKTKINQLSAGGDTSFGVGLKSALDQFSKYGNPDHSPAILFMSDGEHNSAPAPDTFVTKCKNKGIPIYTIGFAKTESEVDITRLKRMSDETGGEYLFASEIFDLQNIFLKLQHKASGWESIATYVGEVKEGETVTAGSFYVDPAIENLRVTLNWPGSNLDLKLYDPFGTQLDFSAPNVIYSRDTKPEYVIIKDPEPGTWTAKVYGKRIGSSEEFYVLVTKYEPSKPSPTICKVQITSNPSIQDRPSIIYANGNYYVAYQSHEKGYGIFIKEFDSQWNFKKKVEVVSGCAYYDSPSLVFANNKLYVAYVSNEKGACVDDYDIIVKEYDPNTLACIRGELYLTSLQSCQDLPALYYKGGYFYLAYQSWETGNGDIFIKKFDSNWNLLKKVQVTSKSSLQDRPSLMYANGYFYVAYFSEETGYYDIFVKRLDPYLNLESWKKQITSESSYQSYPFITYVNNQFAIVYASTETGTLGIYLKTYDSNWNFIEKTKVVDTTANERRPSMTYAQNKYWVAYVHNLAGSDDWNIFAIIPGCVDGSSPTSFPTPSSSCCPTMAVIADKSEYAPGDTVSVSISLTGTSCNFQVTEPSPVSLIAPTGEIVAQQDFASYLSGSLIYGNHWSMGMSFELPEDAPYGYYDVTVSLSGGECTKRVNDLFQVGYPI